MSLGYRDLRIYQAAFELAVDIYKASRTFPDHERFGLTNQIRRSSRAVAAIVAEAYRKKKSQIVCIETGGSGRRKHGDPSLVGFLF